MQEKPKTFRLNVRTLRWGVLALVVAALLVFAGAALAQETQPAAKQVKPDAGLVVVYVVADGPAAAAGVARGDIILAVDDDAVNTLPELRHIVASHDPGDLVVLKVTHGDEERSLSVTLGDNDGQPELGLMAVGGDVANRRMEQRGLDGFDRPGRGGRQGHMPAMPFGEGGMFTMPFGRGEEMIWATAVADGALVMEVAEEGPAAAAGLQAGDVITGLNDALVASSDELVALLADHKPGDLVTVTYARDDESASAEVTLGAHPDDETKAYLGVQLAPAMPGHFGMEDGMMPFMAGEGIISGVVLAEVSADGPAAAAGLEEGDWITAVNGEEIDNPQALVDAVKAAKPGDAMVLTVQGEDDEEAVDVTVTLGANEEGGALLGVQIGGAMRIQRGPGGMDFDFRQFHGEQDGGRGMPSMPFFFGRPDQEQNGDRFEFRVPQFRFQMPDQNEQPAPDVRYFQQPSYTTEGA